MIIDDFLKYRDLSPEIEKLAFANPVIFKCQDIIKNTFEIGDKVLEEEVDLRPPWHCFFAEFRSPINYQEKVGYFCNYIKTNNGWEANFTLFFLCESFVGKPITFNLHINKDGTLDKENAFLNLKDIPMSVLVGFALLSRAITFANLKNISIVENRIDSGLQRKRQDESKLPITKFYTLKINKKLIRKCFKGSDKGNVWNLPLHVVIGHDKDFTQGNGLFGRHKKVVRFDSFVRGNRERGEIKKNYEAYATH